MSSLVLHSNHRILATDLKTVVNCDLVGIQLGP